MQSECRLPDGPANSDKLAHLLLYGVLGALFLRARPDFVERREPSRRLAVLCILLSFIFCALFGAVDEWHQPFFGRTKDVFDWLADASGALIGSTAMAWYLYRRHWRSEHGGGAADQG